MALARLLALLLLLVGAPAVAAESVGAWGSLGGGPVLPLFLRAWDRGAQGTAPPPTRRRGRGNFAGNLALGSRGGAGPGWLPRANVRPSLLLFPPPLASAPPRAPGSDVTKPVSPLLPPHSRPSLVILG